MVFRYGRPLTAYHLVQHPFLLYKLGEKVDNNVLVTRRWVGTDPSVVLGKGLHLGLGQVIGGVPDVAA